MKRYYFMIRQVICLSALQFILIPNGNSQDTVARYDIDAADVVSYSYIVKETEAIRIDGAVVYPRPEPVHPLEELRESEAPGPPHLPAIMLETRKNDPSLFIPPRENLISNKEEMESALLKLRKDHEIFLRDLTPEKPESRIKVDLTEFRFRYETPEDERDIFKALEGKGQWESITVPHYIGPEGKWAAYYRKVLEIPEDFWEKECYILHFNGVDYWSQIYLNGRCVGTHTGGWAPFEMDVTRFLRRDTLNILVVRVENDYRMRVYGGERIYAATGPGFDKPDRMWNPSGSGAGIWQKCWLEARPDIHINDIYVIPDVAEKTADIRINVNNLIPGRGPVPIDLQLDIFPKNFEGKAIRGIPVKAEPAGGQSNEYRVILKLDEFREWSPEHPWLYTVRASVKPVRGSVGVFDPGPGQVSVTSDQTGDMDCLDDHFGMRTFRMDTGSEPKGRLYLNGEPVILRGSNEMSAIFQDVIRGDTEQLIEDILIFKLANLNFIRLCQHPRQPEAYDMFDRLGIMVQTDLPIFGEVRRPLVPEEIKQAMEMEMLVRSHPSNIMVSLINEPSDLYNRELGHRHLLRPDLHRFFQAATAGIGIFNPDRIVKPIDGDYDPPSPGFPDNHLYTMWYLDHGLPIGKLVKGYWVPNKAGWYRASGEWGGSGLENAACMFQYFPQDWLPEGNDQDAKWDPRVMGNDSQVDTRGYAWFDRQETLGEYIAVSQAHQERNIDWVQRAFRRQSDRIISTAQFFLVEGWPNNCWGFGIVDYMRNPKPAFYAFREACMPLMADIRSDRLHYYGGEELAAEIWICNDKKAPFEIGRVIWKLEMNDEQLFIQSAEVNVPSFGPAFVGNVPYRIPQVRERSKLKLTVALLDPDRKNISDYAFEFEIFPEPDPLKNLAVSVLSEPGNGLLKLSEMLKFRINDFSPGSRSDVLVIESSEDFKSHQADVMEFIGKGGDVIFLSLEPGEELDLDSDSVRIFKMAGKHFISRKTDHPVVAEFQPQDFSYWYNPDVDYMDHVASSYVDGTGLRPVFLSIDFARVPKPLFKDNLYVDAELNTGKGKVIFSQLSGLNRLEYEPAALMYYRNLLEYLLK